MDGLGAGASAFINGGLLLLHITSGVSEAQRVEAVLLLFLYSTHTVLVFFSLSLDYFKFLGERQALGVHREYT